jgi:transposase
MLKPFGLVAGKGGRQPFIDRVRELVADGPLKDAVEALLTALQEVSRQIGILTRRLMGLARQDKAARRLMTAPGVGSLVALAYISVIDTPDRFSSSSSVGAYLGLTPRRYQSGEIDRSGRISKCGDPLLRTYLFEAAGIILNRVSRWSLIKAWGRGLPERSVGRRLWWRSPVSCRSSSTECGTMVPTSAGPKRRSCRHEIVAH